MELTGTDKEFFARESEPKAIEVAKSYGSYLIGQDGNKYIDFTMGWCVGNIGWNHEEVENAIKNFDGPSYVSPYFEYRPWMELSQLLAELTPGNLKKCFRATGGTEAVEIALQAALEYTGRNKFLAIDGAYHGNSIATRGLVSSAYGFFNWQKISPPLNEEIADKVEEILKEKNVAALIMEPVIINLGVLIPEKKFMERIQASCRKYGTLLIMDEVACGFGRTGKFFASEHFGIEPDIMCLAKGITGGAAGLGATIMREEVGECLQEDSFPYSTFGWHPLSVEAALANIRYLQRNWNQLEENIQSLSEYFRQRLSEMNFLEEPEIHIMGLAINLKFEDEEYAQQITSKAQEKGLLISESISMYPALNIEFETVKEGLDILETCL